MSSELVDDDQPLSVVVGASTPLVDAIIRHLGTRGHDTVSIGAAAAGIDSANSVDHRFADACGDRRVDIVVHADVPADAARPQALMDLDDDEWDLRCESIIRTTLLSFQAAHRHMSSGGSLVLLVPTISLPGAAGLAAWSAAAETQRVLAKTAARRWRSAGIRVNVVSVPPVLLTGESAAESESGSHAIDVHAPSPSEVADLVCMLTGPDAKALTGSTLVADGGSLMVP